MLRSGGSLSGELPCVFYEHHPLAGLNMTGVLLVCDGIRSSGGGGGVVGAAHTRTHAGSPVVMTSVQWTCSRGRHASLPSSCAEYVPTCLSATAYQSSVCLSVCLSVGSALLARHPPVCLPVCLRLGY